MTKKSQISKWYQDVSKGIVPWSKVAWAYTKKYWYVAALGIGVIIAYILLKDNSTNFADRLKEINDLHRDEVEKINKIRVAELKGYEENRRKLQERLQAIKLQYIHEKGELDDKTNKRVEEIVEQYGDDPERLADELAAAIGFRIDTGDSK